MNPTEPALAVRTPPPAGERPMIHYTELPACSPDSPIATENAFYQREVGRLLAEGHAGRWALIKGEQVIGIWDSRAEAFAVVDERYPDEHVLVRQLLEWEPLLNLSTWWHRAHAQSADSQRRAAG